VADGAMKELTASGENSLLIKASGDAFWKEREYDHKKFAENLNSIANKRDVYSKNSRIFVEKKYTLEKMIEKYLELF
jgi:glycosyltransferase involved in cell wall biosynthesis